MSKILALLAIIVVFATNNLYASSTLDITNYSGSPEQPVTPTHLYAYISDLLITYGPEEMNAQPIPGLWRLVEMNESYLESQDPNFREGWCGILSAVKDYNRYFFSAHIKDINNFTFGQYTLLTYVWTQIFSQHTAADAQLCAKDHECLYSSIYEEFIPITKGSKRNDMYEVVDDLAKDIKNTYGLTVPVLSPTGAVSTEMMNKMHSMIHGKPMSIVWEAIGFNEKHNYDAEVDETSTENRAHDSRHASRMAQIFSKEALSIIKKIENSPLVHYPSLSHHPERGSEAWVELKWGSFIKKSHLVSILNNPATSIAERTKKVINFAVFMLSHEVNMLFENDYFYNEEATMRLVAYLTPHIFNNKVYDASDEKRCQSYVDIIESDGIDTADARKLPIEWTSSLPQTEENMRYARNRAIYLSTYKEGVLALNDFIKEHSAELGLRRP